LTRNEVRFSAAGATFGATPASATARSREPQPVARPGAHGELPWRQQMETAPDAGSRQDPWDNGPVVKRITAVGALLIPTIAFAGKLEPDDLPGPPLETIKNPAKVEVPAIPAFDLPVTEPGFRSPRELRVRGRSSLGAEVKVKGYVTWIYDCGAQLASVNPEANRAQILMSIDTDPSLCERPNFYLGDNKDTSQEGSIWIVDVPRAPTKNERQRLSRDEIKAWPVVPKIARGDFVTVTGTWAQHSAHDEHSPDGLLIFKSLAHGHPGTGPAATAPVASPKEPVISVVTKAPLREEVDPAVRNTSVDHLNACNKANLAKQYDAAIKACQLAIKLWAGNHHAWYAWSGAHIARREWAQARVPIERAVALRPDLAMYQLYLGISLYETEVQRAKEEQARRENKKPEDIALDPSGLKLDAARDALVRASSIAPMLWRAHYYLGRVFRDSDDPRRAAEQFRHTIVMHPTYRYGYIQLIQLYRRWDYVDQALAIANLGTATVPTAEAGELWFELGMAYDAKRADAKAIDAFTTAIAVRPDDMSAKFQRGQILARKGDVAAARRDLEEVARSTDPKLVSEKQVATQLLAQIAARKN
jgi:tetratricopeptide (TPR) repeat protein